jgi:putative transposase
MLTAADLLSEHVDTKLACEVLKVSRASYYRWKYPKKTEIKAPQKPHHRALSNSERQDVLNTLHEMRFVDKAPAEIYSILLDEGQYICSPRTMYRILESENEIRERRNQLRHPKYSKPELLATGPNEVWSWDITKLLGPVKWTFYYLYVIMDIFSRYAVGWMLARRENAEFARQLIGETSLRQNIRADQLTIHADRGTAMRSLTVAQLYASLGITKSFNRPNTSTDNPFSESQFKTLKYSPEFPGRFGSFEDALSFCRTFFQWYNNEHRHSGISYLTPMSVHYGKSEQILKKRKEVLLNAYEKYPERFVRKIPAPGKLPDSVWINEPKEK